MDGTKRKANGLAVPRSNPIDLGSTPPWALPPIYHEESALRFTQTPEFHLTVDPAALYGRTAAVPRTLPARTPLNLAPTVQAPPRPRKQIGKRALPAVTPTVKDDDGDAEDDDDEIICGVDTENGRDSVYLLNADQGSWSGPLESEAEAQVLPDQAILALRHLKRAQQLAEQVQLVSSEDEASEAGEYSDSEADTVVGEASEKWQQSQDEVEQVYATQDDYEEEKKKWHKDLHLRNVIRRVKAKLRSGAVLTLERLGPINLTINCAHPECPAPEHRIPPGAYYVILGQPRQLESAERFCLFCLEWLWNGREMCSPLPTPEVALHTSAAKLTVSNLNLDGAMDDDRLMAAGMELASVTTGTPASSRSSMPRSSIPPTPVTEYSSACSPVFHHDIDKDESAARSETPSPIARRVEVNTVVSREARGLMQGFGEAFLDGQWRVAKKRGDVANKVDDGSTRRSARLQPKSKKENVTTQAEDRIARSAQITKAKSGSNSRAASNDTIADEVVKAEKKLEEMHKQRNLALISLEPGQIAVVRHPRCPKTAAKHMSVDEFGVMYTDLLAEPATKYWAQQHVRGTQLVNGRPESTIAGPVHEDLRDSDSARAWAEGQEEHWCICHGIEDGRDMTRCANERCLVGWYHTDCIDEESQPDDRNDRQEPSASGVTESDTVDWLCHLCTIYGQGKAKSMLPRAVTAERVEKMFAPSYILGAKGSGDEVDMSFSFAKKLLPHQPSVNQRHDLVQLTQLDGPSESPKAPGRAQKHTPDVQSHLYGIPASLLSSKHAPTLEELACYPLAVRYPPLSSPARTRRSETPGGPYTPGSTTSAGRWRHPPTRFQQLAAYIKPGNSLDGPERAAVEAWKLATTEQMEWEKHLERTDTVRGMSPATTDEDDANERAEDARYDVKENDGLEEGLEEGEIAEESVVSQQATVTQVTVENAERDGVDGSVPEEKAGLSKSDCRGKDLTAVLAEIAQPAIKQDRETNVVFRKLAEQDRITITTLLQRTVGRVQASEQGREMVEALRETATHLFKTSKQDCETVFALLEKDKQHRRAGEECVLV
ncbi:hypothetical protein LTR36_003417 [Oleoguttula mirabilis]|uniref:Zinc finger PHD-type domain-containing protein n=1 Tax=Oleoguttula mirabilis TaxID=1507867 RepID=A0AAV9JJ65_9PEZI|nr:hypothetical protein LTR36_003417 [Oleoguttula mirabilis]